MNDLTQQEYESCVEFIREFGEQALPDAFLLGLDILSNREKVRDAETELTHPSFKFGNIHHE